MKKLKHYIWLVVAGCFISLSPFFTKEIHIGEHVISRPEAFESGALYLLGVLGLLLLIGIAFSIKGNLTGDFICKAWGIIYSIAMVPFAYIYFGIKDILLIIVMVMFAAAWYYWGSKVIVRANA